MAERTGWPGARSSRASCGTAPKSCWGSVRAEGARGARAVDPGIHAVLAVELGRQHLAEPGVDRPLQRLSALAQKPAHHHAAGADDRVDVVCSVDLDEDLAARFDGQ